MFQTAQSAVCQRKAKMPFLNSMQVEVNLDGYLREFTQMCGRFEMDTRFSTPGDPELR